MRVIPIFAFLLFSLSCHGQVRINELMASNVRSFPDVADFDDYPDWIELHNTSPETQSLTDYYLSDDPDTPTKWQFPYGSNIAADEYLAVSARILAAFQLHHHQTSHQFQTLVLRRNPLSPPDGSRLSAPPPTRLNLEILRCRNTADRDMENPGIR